jgi:hypothetical protein
VKTAKLSEKTLIAGRVALLRERLAGLILDQAGRNDNWWREECQRIDIDEHCWGKVVRCFGTG